MSPGDGPDPNNVKYVPTTWPGARLPHVWLDDGSALHDRLGPWYSLLRLGGTAADTSALEGAFRDRGAPLESSIFPTPPSAKPTATICCSCAPISTSCGAVTRHRPTR